MTDIQNYWIEDQLEPRDGYVVVTDEGTLSAVTDPIELAAFPEFGRGVNPRPGDILRVLIIGNLNDKP